MSIDAAFQGSLFASDFLCDAITRSPDWQELDDASLEELKAVLARDLRPLPGRRIAQRKPDRG